MKTSSTKNISAPQIDEVETKNQNDLSDLKNEKENIKSINTDKNYIPCDRLSDECLEKQKP